MTLTGMLHAFRRDFLPQSAQSGAAATDEDFDLVTENTEVEPEDTEQFILRGRCVSSVNSGSKDSGYRADRIICTQENNGFRDSGQRSKTEFTKPDIVFAPWPLWLSSVSAVSMPWSHSGMKFPG
jgi:pSer/pThr/pTyr-binding forkhead associated (FHA) protein